MSIADSVTRPNALNGRGQRHSMSVTGNGGAWELRRSPRTVAAARRLAQEALTSWGARREDADTVTLLVSELVTNAVEHAAPPLLMTLEHEVTNKQILVTVTDGGPASVPGEWVSTCEPDEHGRGMDIVALLSTDHGHRRCPGGAISWARVAIPLSGNDGVSRHISRRRPEPTVVDSLGPRCRPAATSATRGAEATAGVPGERGRQEQEHSDDLPHSSRCEQPARGRSPEVRSAEVQHARVERP